MTRIAQQRDSAAQQVRRKALQPEERFCRFLRKPVTILVEYPDYHAPFRKGVEGEIYCSMIIECYQKNMECRYSGITPLYPDPFEGVPRDVREAAALFGPPDDEEGDAGAEGLLDLSDLEAPELDERPDDDEAPPRSPCESTGDDTAEGDELV